VLGSYTADPDLGTAHAVLPEVFHFPPISASFVRMHITSNHGDLGNVVFGEAAFEVVFLPGDYNHNNVVDAADYVVWRKTGGTQTGYETWRANFGVSLGVGSGAALPSAEPLSAVPEPLGLALFALGLPALARRCRCRHRQRANHS